MKVLRKSRPAFTGRDIAPEIYIPLVNSLYQEGRTLIVGYFATASSIVLTYWKTGNLLLLACALAFSLVAVGRALDMRAYAKVRATVKSSESARRWEIRYGIGAASSLAILGLWCYFGLTRTSDPFVSLVSFTATIAYVIGITGRNFGTSRLVVAQIMSVAVPMIAGLLRMGEPFHLAFALLLPCFMSRSHSFASGYAPIFSTP